jgi:hypothetical protein
MRPIGAIRTAGRPTAAGSDPIAIMTGIMTGGIPTGLGQAWRGVPVIPLSSAARSNPKKLRPKLADGEEAEALAAASVHRHVERAEAEALTPDTGFQEGFSTQASTHKFAIGQMVSFSPDQGQIGAADRGGSYEVVCLLPKAASVAHCRYGPRTAWSARISSPD